ncbi:VWA domain-containing protein [Leptolyngbya sp. PCC 6406]|uniref:VWA domain-containing protein n=1 Tax=Leptolyngbya sp. PCC 6406 TaxID=1173264 RepID=UPI0002AC153E|nr:VWA domain-containing protein [Leptolyngbya sp. PCC 6406]
MTDALSALNQERLRRWRLILGAETSAGGTAGDSEVSLGVADRAIDQTLEALYDCDRKGSLGASSPRVARWLGDIRTYFPPSVVKVMQQDALERLNLRQMLLEPELLEAMEPDVNLVSNLLAFSSIMPAKTKETARLVVRRIVDDLIRKLENPTRQAIAGSLNRATRNRRPRHNEIDWHRTIRANLKHYQPTLRTIIPETRIGYGRKRTALRDIVLCVDQSGSMATSVVYAGIFSAVMAMIPAMKTHLVVFDTAVVDLTDLLQDPVEVLFGIQLGGGTDINRALTYCQSLIRNPQDTILVLISDLFEGGNAAEMRQRVSSLVHSGVQMITLLALNDDGVPCYDGTTAQFMTTLGIPAFACTPDRFPDLMAAAIKRQDLRQWVAAQQ